MGHKTPPYLTFQAPVPTLNRMRGTEVSIRQRVESVREAMEGAARRAGRAPEAVTLMAVVKTRSPEEVREVVEAGVRILGENRVQEGEEHLAALGPPVLGSCRIRFIGRLQANKARRAVRAFHAVDGVDSADLLRRLSRIACEESLQREVLLEVNLGGESQKGGILPHEASELALLTYSLPGISLTGLQGVSPLFEEAEASRPYFRRLAKLFEQVKEGHPRPERFTVLSMGMSHDFEVAVEEGATLVRVGTALFGQRRRP